MYLPQWEISSKVAFSSDRFLGWIKTHTIPPLHAVALLKACLMKLENTTTLHPTPQELFTILFEGAMALHSGTQLFTAMNSEILMNDNNPILLLMGNYPHHHEDDPLVLVMIKKPHFYSYLTFLSSVPRGMQKKNLLHEVVLFG